jgi:hypothetical protein
MGVRGEGNRCSPTRWGATAARALSFYPNKMNILVHFQTDPTNAQSPEGRGAELAGDGVADALEDALRHMQDLSVGEPEDGQPQRFKPTVTTEVSLRPRKVLCSVSFDHQAYLIAEEVDRIRTDRMLTPEFQTNETTVPQELPERTLCRRRRAT